MTNNRRFIDHPILQLTRARLREFLREPEAVFWVFCFPILMIVALGLAFRSESTETITVDVVEGPNIEKLEKALSEDERFRVQVNSVDDSHQRLRTGKTELVVSPQTGSESVTYQYEYDPTRPGSVLARNLVDDVLQRAAGRQDVAETEDVEISEPGSRYIDFLVPGLIGMGLMGGGIWAVGFAVVDMRIRKLLKRFIATPMKRHHFLAGLMLSRLAFMIPEVIVIVVFSRLAFDVECRGSYLTLGVLVFLGAIEFTGIGLLIASRAKTLEAASGLMNLVMVPMWIGSGIFFSSERFPEMLQPVIRVLPLTPLIGSIRQVMLEGTELTGLGPELAIMLGWCAFSFGLALKFFRWT
ncbi:MAG: ABC transporter permease [Planctomycetaceae bacterium]|nr:ABC transporter permease [Planctomycetaceae bacterium]